jgi:hypothetical protein
MHGLNTAYSTNVAVKDKGGYMNIEYVLDANQTIQGMND